MPLEDYPEQMWRRVADGIASVEPTPEKQTEWSDKFYELLRDFKFVPGGRTLSGAGTANEVTYYNCYVVGLGEDPLNPDAPKKPMLDPEPSREAFFTALMQMTDIMSRSGGVGINLSALPPKGTPISASGRGSNGSVRPTVALSLEHPDIASFLAEKDGPNLQHVDMAVIVPPGFDQALAEDADWTPQWNDWQGDTVRARELWARLGADEGRHVSLLRPSAETITLEDSRVSIVDGAARAAMMLFQGETPVVDFSQLRPKGAYIKTVNGTSSGPVAWMYLYDAVARCDDGAAPAEKGVIWFGEIASVITGKTIQQGGSRRGALMLMLDDDHPDIEEFIAAKRISPETRRPVMIEHANMSLCISDAFMAAVAADLPWDLKWQGTVVRTVRARAIWDQICTAAWTTAEPGVVFMQRAREQSPMWYAENIRCTNPCVTGDTLVYTAEGLYPAAELAAIGSAIPVVSTGSGTPTFEQATHVWESGVKPVYRLQTKEGYSVRLTAEHRVFTTRGWVEARELADGDKIHLLNGEGGFGSGGSETMGLILGWLVGEGHITNRGNSQSAIVLSFWGEDRELAPTYAESVNQLVAMAAGVSQHPVGVVDVPDRDEAHVRSVRLLRMIDPVLLENKMQVPPSVFRGNRDMQRGFLQALFSADGSVQGSQEKG
ncbi:MAG: ribonucleotide reductase N-terminal alpha domain-containing protein, partial [Ktedonobacterales bacterium]